jgi:coenzyme F420-reducing hydrogenase alpha subunit
MNNVAQIIECVHELYFGMELCEKLQDMKLVEEDMTVKPRAGRGVGIVEAPRGILFHDYTYDDKGKIIKANCIIPTNQNYGNIQDDLNAFVPSLLNSSKDEIALGMEMLVRAYDPCISCSVHLLNVDFV